ncbi:hypothetical protein EON66_07460 [archaeon]|nr:MAG: hypothetical protein EON66_07460 [archaeon]
MRLDIIELHAGAPTPPQLLLPCALQVGIARYVKRKGGKMMLGMLLPAVIDAFPVERIKDPLHAVHPSPLGVDCLFFVPMPFDDDIRQSYEFTSLTSGAGADKTVPSDVQLHAADALIDAFNLGEVVCPRILFAALRSRACLCFTCTISASMHVLACAHCKLIYTVRLTGSAGHG